MKTILGLQVEEKPFEYKDKLPYFISGNYSFSTMNIAGFDCVFMKPLGSLGTAESVKKHIIKVKEICSMPVAIYPDELSIFRRNSFLTNGIPFVTEKQAYLPFMGTYLEKRDEISVKVDTFTASSQAALVKWLLNPCERIKVTELMKGLGYTNMTESRVAKQLGATDCFDIEKEGTVNVLVARFGAEETFYRLKKYMTTPVETVGYIYTPTNLDLIVAGVDALSERTMINPDRMHTYAGFAIDKKLLKNELVDVETQALVEIWKYDPRKLLWNDGMADPISVALSLDSSSDERIEAAVEDMLREVWR